MNISKAICTLTVALLTGCGPNILIDLGEDFTPIGDGDNDPSGDTSSTETLPDVPYEPLTDMPEECEPGTLGCDCVDGGCESGLECEGGLCAEPEAAWEDVRCIESESGNTTCFGRPAGSSDAWVVVVSRCSVEGFLDSGLMELTPSWTGETCAPGMAPENFMPDSFCVWLADHGASACYSGDDKWLTQVKPVCDVVVGTEGAWPEWMCGGDVGELGESPWEDVLCSPTAPSCAALDGLDVMTVWPTCWVDGLKPAAIPTCD